MTGAEALIATLENNGIDVCFANPGTSEIHLVAAINNAERMRGVLALFEGVVTGAADGYGRMAGKPACTLLHLGPGLANGLANLHNAKRAESPILNIVGDHPSYHLQYDTPLTTDITAIARNVSHRVHTVSSVRNVGVDSAYMVRTAMEGNGQIATLILPANVAWEQGGIPLSSLPEQSPSYIDENVVSEVKEALTKARRPALLLRGEALQGEGLNMAARIAAYTGASLLSDTFSPRMRRGAGLPLVERIPYRSEDMQSFLGQFDLLVMVGNVPPAVFFAYPGKPSWPISENCSLVTLAQPYEDIGMALCMLEKKLQVPQDIQINVAPFAPPVLPPEMKLSADNAMQIIANLLPEDAIICDESISSGFPYYHYTAQANPHDYLQLTGGAIGSMLSASIGAAIACPDRKVICLIGDGSAMYTVQALWTIAREQLNVLVVIYANKKYAILQEEVMRMGAAPSGEDFPLENYPSMLEINNPDLNWVTLSASMGVEAICVETTNQLINVYESAVKSKSPLVVEVVI